MKKCNNIRCIILLAVLTAFCAGAEENLVKDGNFESADFAVEKDGNTPGVWTAYVIKDGDGGFTTAPGGRSGSCAKYEKRADGSHNFHLNQVVRVIPDTSYEVRAWMKGDAHLKPVIAISGMNWKPVSTASMTLSAEWKEIRLFFNSGTNTQLRFEWFAGAKGTMFTGIAGTSYLDDVSLEPLTGKSLALSVTVHADEAVKTGIPAGPIGVSENVFNTSDRHYPERKISQVKTLAMLGGRTVRGLEGNIADVLIWSVPPYDKPAIRAAAYHPRRNYMDQFFKPDGTLVKPLEFDEFIDSGRAAGVAEFFYVIGIDALNAIPGEWNYIIPDVTNAIVAAAEGQARFARERGASLWFEIGNETDLNDYKEKKLVPWTAEGYIEAVKLIAPAIKRGNPDAKVGVNAGFRDNKEWLDKIIPAVAGHIDFFVAHAYSPTGTYAIDRVNDAIDRAAVPDALKSKWPICLTETSSYNPGSPIRNDLAESVKNFGRMGVNLLQRRVTYMHFWTDRAADNAAKSGKNAFHPDGGLLPMGQVLAIWNEHAGDRMLRVNAELPSIPVFATKKTNGGVNVFLLNTVGIPLLYSVTVDGATARNAELWTWTGTNDQDVFPRWKSVGPVSRENGLYTVALPSTGFTMLSLPR
ncbi:MAG: carbohydrate binding domain-containing protein [Spirochaetes bacterium]|nr:carbohydrate binding domain-containing protein [Spirochaetota bacterium]